MTDRTDRMLAFIACATVSFLLYNPSQAAGVATSGIGSQRVDNPCAQQACYSTPPKIDPTRAALQRSTVPALNVTPNAVVAAFSTDVPSSANALRQELAAPSFMNFQNGYLKLSGHEKISFDGKILRINEDGDLHVIDENNTVLWRSKTQANCGACSLFLQGDGNLVLYADGKGIWSTGTYGRGSFLTLSSVPPYLSIRDNKFNVIWKSSDDPGPTALLAASRVGPQAAASATFLDSLAVNAHVLQNGTSATDMMKMLNFIGVKTIRAGWGASVHATYADLAKRAVRFNFVQGDPYAAGALKELERISSLAPGALLAVEGPNEINNWSFVTDGVTSPHGWPNDAGPLAQKFMTKLYSNVHEKAKLSGTVVYNLTWGGTIDAEKYGMFDLAAQADFGNIHFYPAGQPYSELQSAIASAYHHVLPNQAVITETGYNTAHVSPEAQAVLVMNLYLSAFQQGFNKTYIYELYDEWEKYGLFIDANRPKPAAVALHNLTTLLADRSIPSKLGQLNYSIPNLPATAHTLLLQKSDGAFYLVVWNEVPIYANGSDIQVPAVPLTVNFGAKMRRASVVDPIVGLGAIQKDENSSKMVINLAGHALIIELVP